MLYHSCGLFQYIFHEQARTLTQNAIAYSHEYIVPNGNGNY